MIKSFLKNSSYLLLSQTLAKIIAFFYNIFLAQKLGVENFGFYTAALAYFSLFSTLSDLGVNRFIVREVSLLNQDPSRVKKSTGSILATSILFRLSTVALAWGMLTVVLTLFDPDLFRRNLAILAVLAILPQSISLGLDAVLVALIKISWSAVGILALSLATALSGIGLVVWGMGVWGAVMALIIGQIVYAATLVILTWWQRTVEWGKVNWAMFLRVIKGSLPYGLLIVLGWLYFRVDTLMLSYIKGPYDTGIYGVAYRFLEAVVLIPAAFSAVLFPYLARLHEVSQEEIKNTYFKSLGFFGVVAVPTFLGYFFLLPLLISFWLPAYQSSAAVLKILSFTIPLMFLHVPAAVVLLSTDRYLRWVIVLSLGTLVFNIVANILLIPPFSFLGAAWATVASEALSLMVFFAFLKWRVLR